MKAGLILDFGDFPISSPDGRSGDNSIFSNYSLLGRRCDKMCQVLLYEKRHKDFAWREYAVNEYKRKFDPVRMLGGSWHS